MTEYGYRPRKPSVASWCYSYKAAEGLTSFLAQDVSAPVDLVAVVPSNAAPWLTHSCSRVHPTRACASVCVYWEVKRSMWRVGCRSAHRSTYV